MHILCVVASKCGAGGAVYARPYALTLWEYLHTREDDRIRELIARGIQLDTAALMYVAFHEPEKLKDHYARLERDLGTLPTREEAIAEADGILERFAEMERKTIDAHRVIDGQRKNAQTLLDAAAANAKKTGRH